MRTIGRIDRTGTVSFGDASVSVWEEGILAARDVGGFAGERAWELAFKRQVFARIVQTLNRLGWTCEVPVLYVKQYGQRFAEKARECRKGDLKGFLDVTGRAIKFKMWQGINTPTRPDHGGKYESDKEACMPYVLRLEMERTRRRIRDYLCGVFTGYTFDADSRSIYRKPLAQTALECIERHYAESSHFKGDMAAYLKRNGYTELPSYNTTSADGARLQHGQRVWFRNEYTGRAATGIAYYNINNMWWVLTGRYDYTNQAAFHLHTRPPQNLRGRHFPERRRKRLEQELARATAAMNFERAAVLRDVLFPPDTGPLFHVRRKNDGAFWGPGSCGYTKDSIRAGKYTRAEAESITSSSDGELTMVEVCA